MRRAESFDFGVEEDGQDKMGENPNDSPKESQDEGHKANEGLNNDNDDLDDDSSS